MTATLNTANKVKRRDELAVMPEDIIADEMDNGRRDEHNPDAVVNLAHSIVDQGQLQAVRVRRTEDKSVKLVAGFRRYRAVCYINNNLEEFDLDEPMPVRCSIDMNVNDQRAFEANIIENREREQTTVVDDALNMQRLKDEFGYNNSDVARLFKVKPAWVSQLQRLLNLVTEAQDAVHYGQLSTTAALKLASLEPEQQREAMREAGQDNSKVSNEQMEASIRNQRQKAGKGLSRSVRDIRSLADAWLEDERKTEAEKDFARTLRAYVDGSKGEKALQNMVARIQQSE